MDGFIKAPFLILGAAGTALAILFGDKKPKTFREYIKSLGYVCGGALITNVFTPLLVKTVPLFIGFEYASAMIIGLFGIGLIRALLNLVGKLNTDFFGTLKNAKDVSVSYTHLRAHET